MERLFCILLGYGFGCFLTAELVGKFKGKDIRNIDPDAPGRGNPGMANVMLNLGFLPGLIVFIGDILKNILAMSMAYLIFKDELAYLYAGFGVLLGHNYPFWRKFNGGKGVLVTIIWLVAIMPIHCWLALISAALITLITGYLNLGAIIFPIIAIPFAFKVLNIESGILVTLAAIIMLLRNKTDLIKILNGTSSRFFLFKKK